MKTLFTLQVSSHPGAGARVPSQEANESWKTVYDGPLAGGKKEAREAVDALSKWYKHARAFAGGTVGRLLYAVYDMKK